MYICINYFLHVMQVKSIGVSAIHLTNYSVQKKLVVVDDFTNSTPQKLRNVCQSQRDGNVVGEADLLLG